ncbi:hypothetical protein [Saccharothrix variisporea]|uniref:hypothetical protein n=1 Tax=Saccharothrix variisporea TaxID=543527 RepID=UPI0011C369B2|nr:hypothetical protein [Saccharothrix variisporea]
MQNKGFARLLGVLLCVLVAAGCVSLGEVVKLAGRVQDAGYSGVSVHHQTSNGFDTISVSAFKPTETDDDGAAIFRLIWDTYPEEVDQAVVSVNGRPRAASKAELERAFGPRKIQPKESGTAATVALLVLVVLLACAVVVVVVVRVRRRRRRQLPPPPYPQGPYYYQP